MKAQVQLSNCGAFRRFRGLGPSACLQSQRDCVFQPRVARNELPWVEVRTKFNPHGVVSPNDLWAATPLGLFGCARISQGSSFLATLGFEPESLWDSILEFPKGIEASWGAALALI